MKIHTEFINSKEAAVKINILIKKEKIKQIKEASIIFFLLYLLKKIKKNKYSIQETNKIFKFK